MSYILEALKKAEAERSGVAAKPAHGLPTFAAARSRPSGLRNPWMWSTLAAVTVMAAGAAWLLMAQKKPAPVATAPAQTAARPVPAPITPPAPAPVAPAQIAAAPAAAPPNPTTASEEPAKPKPKVEKKPAEKTAEKPVEKKRPAAAEEPKQAASPAPAAEPPVTTLRELPAQIQREIPTLAVGGYIYSGNKAERSVLINKRLLREGDEITPGLTLEKMTQSGMVLNYKGYRYRTSY